jgi:hypothetical protein
VPADLRKILTSNPKALGAWEDITPLARNEWICETCKLTSSKAFEEVLSFERGDVVQLVGTLPCQ